MNKQGFLNPGSISSDKSVGWETRTWVENRFLVIHLQRGCVGQNNSEPKTAGFPFGVCVRVFSTRLIREPIKIQQQSTHKHATHTHTGYRKSEP